MLKLPHLPPPPITLPPPTTRPTSPTTPPSATSQHTTFQWSKVNVEAAAPHVLGHVDFLAPQPAADVTALVTLLAGDRFVEPRRQPVLAAASDVLAIPE